MSRRRGSWVAVFLAALAVSLSVSGAFAQDEAAIDLDRWHEQFPSEWEGSTEFEEPRWLIGLYPGVSGVLGLPDLISAQANIFVSVRRSQDFSLYLGYGREWGSPADGEIFTLGWGGLREVPVASRQYGFYGKFLRYRRWNDTNHGRHDGLSIGTESGAGFFSLTFEVGAARSDRNHWLFVAQVAIKVALPIGIPIGKPGVS